MTPLFFTDRHSDHGMNYARLAHAARDEGGAPLKLFGPAPLARITEGCFGPDGVLSHELHAGNELRPGLAEGVSPR